MCADPLCVCVCVGVKKSELELVRYNELKAKKSLLEEHLQIKLEQLYNLCLQEAVSIIQVRTALPLVAVSHNPKYIV